MFQDPSVEGREARQSATDRVNNTWGFWATAAWVAAALVLKDDLFPRFEHALLDHTAVGRAISNHLALGALNTALVWLVPILLLLVAVRIRRWPARKYFAWVAPRPGFIVPALAAGVALQLAGYAIPYLAGADMTASAVEQYRSTQNAGNPVWLPLFLSWPAYIAAPLVEESIFRGFLWRGWQSSPLGVRGTWILSSFVFAAYHIPKAIDMGLDGPSATILLSEDLLLGFLLGWLRWHAASLVPSIAAHFAYNVIPPLVTLLIGAIVVGHLTGP
jgi:membrane protease YdiL (CAAX protease family)